MADQVIALELNIDTNAPDALDQIQQKIEELKQKVAGAKDGTQELVDAQAQLGQAQDLYQQLTTAADTHTQSVKGGTEAYREFRSETRAGLGNLLNLQKGTAEYNAELTKIASHKAEFRELQESIRLADPTRSVQAFAEIGRKGAEAFRGIGAAAAFATGSDDEFLKTLFKVEAVTESLNGAMAIQELWHHRLEIAAEAQKKAMLLLKAVTSPLGAAISVLVAGAIAYYAAWKSGGEEVHDTLEQNIAAIKDENDTRNQQTATAKSALESQLQLLKDEKASYDQIVTVRKQIEDLDKTTLLNNLEAAKATLQVNEEKAKQSDKFLEGQEKLKEVKEKLKNLQIDDVSDNNVILKINEALKKTDFGDESKNPLAVTRGALITLKKELVANDEFEKFNKDINNSKASVETINQQLKNFQNTVKSGNIKDADHEKSEADKARAEITKNQEAEFAAAVDRFKKNEVITQNYTEQQYKDMKDAEEKKVLLMKIEGSSERDLINAEIEEKLKLNKDGENGILKIQIEGAAKLKALDEKDKKEANDRDMDAAAKHKRIREGEFEVAQDYAGALVSLGSLMTKEGEKQNEIQKGLALVKIGVDTARAISAAVAASAENPANAATFGGAGAIQFASSIAQILANIAEAKQLLEGGNSGGVSTSTGSMPSYSAPQINSTVFGGNPKTDKNGNADYGYQGMIKTYITETDMDEAQRLAYYQNINRRGK